MKRFLLLVFAAIALCGCADPNRYVIEGQIGGEDRTLYLYLFQDDTPLATVDSHKGRFRLEGNAEIPAISILCDDPDMEGDLLTVVFLEPGTITVAEDDEAPGMVLASGTELNDAYRSYSVAQSRLLDAWEAGSSDEELLCAMDSLYQLTRTNMEENRDNLFGVMMLIESSDLSDREILDEIGRFSEHMQQTDELTRLREQAEGDLGTESDDPCSEVVLPDMEGSDVSLFSVLEDPGNQYVLLDFWASWSDECMDEAAGLTTAYEAFHDKGFEIYGVSLDDDYEQWFNAIVESGMLWIQVCPCEETNPAAEEYGIESVPANFLIDKEGRIIARDLYGEALYEKLSELL